MTDENELASFVMIMKLDKNKNPYYFTKSKPVQIDFTNTVTFLYPFETNDGNMAYRLVMRKGNK
jgi:hypothetical protein